MERSLKPPYQNPPPQAKLEIPATIYVSGQLLSEKGADYFLRITDTSAENLFAQTEVRLRYERTVNPLAEGPEGDLIIDPLDLATRIPREDNTLVIVFTHQFLHESKSEAHPYGRLDYAATHRGWIVVGMYARELGERFASESTLRHELGHVFGANHSDDQNSVMCSSASVFNARCASDSLAFDANSLGAIEGGIKMMNRMGFEGYQILRYPPAAPTMQRTAEETQRPLTVIFQAKLFYSGCEGLSYELLPRDNYLSKAAQNFADRLGLNQQTNLQIRRGLTEECYKNAYLSRPLNDAKEEYHWGKTLDFVRNPFYSFAFGGQIQIHIDERVLKFFGEKTLTRGVLHEVAHQTWEIKNSRFANWMEKELAVDKYVALWNPEYTRDRALADLDQFIAFKENQWDWSLLLPELSEELANASSALKTQKQYYLKNWK